MDGQGSHLKETKIITSTIFFHISTYLDILNGKVENWENVLVIIAVNSFRNR